MKGNSSPTAKLDSQLTIPAIMKAAGRYDCSKSSPVRTKGIPPEREHKQPCHSQSQHEIKNNKINNTMDLERILSSTPHDCMPAPASQVGVYIPVCPDYIWLGTSNHSKRMLISVDKMYHICYYCYLDCAVLLDAIAIWFVCLPGSCHLDKAIFPANSVLSSFFFANYMVSFY